MGIKNINAILAVCVIIGMLASFLLVIQKPLYVDEIAYFYTISNFCKLNFVYLDFISMLPGYHFFGGLFGWLTNCTESWIRFFNLIVSAFSIVVLYKIAQELGIKENREKALLYIVLPILFPFFFLIYTDVLSLLFVLAMFYFSLKGNYFSAGIFGLLSFVTRQNNILWVLFSVAYILIGKSEKIGLDKLKEAFSPGFIKKVLPYIAVILIMTAFFIKNGGFNLGDKAQQPNFFFGPMNIYTILFFFFWINLPENIFNFRKIICKIKGLDRKVLSIMLIGIAMFFGFFLMTFKIDHPYNNYQIYSYFIRNKLLHFFDASIILKSVFFVFALYSVFSIWATKLRERRQYLVYPFSFVILAASWLIETRYFIIPFVLFNLFAVRERKVEKYLILWYLFATIIYMYLFLTMWTFW